SNSAYAMLGLAACERAGVTISRRVLARAAGWWTASQNEDGGFGYRADRESSSYASMTASGLHALLLASRELASTRAGGQEVELGERVKQAIERGDAWLAKHFSVRENFGSAYQEGRLLYGLYAIERVGAAETASGAPSTRALPEDWHEQ